MKFRSLIFLVVYYVIIFLLILAGKHDPGSSLGYGYMIIAWAIFALIIQGVLIFKKFLIAKTPFDIIAILLASPIGLIILAVILQIVLGLK
jgi:hypothetical protein